MVFGADTVNNVLVNKSGTVVKNKAKLKDNNDAYYVVNKYGVVLAYYTSEDAYNDSLTYDRSGSTNKKITVSSAMLAAVDHDDYERLRTAAIAAKQS